MKRVKMRQQRRKGKGMPLALRGIVLAPEINYETPEKRRKQILWGQIRTERGPVP